jgi:hypothetical protein
MKTKFLSCKFNWRRAGIGILIGAVILFAAALIFVVLAQNGQLTPQV